MRERICLAHSCTDTLLVSELFESIQGEGSHTGYPTFFIRLAGCNLRCSYCDTEYAWKGGQQIAIQDLVTQVKASGLTMVLLTGGEPLLQPDAVALLEILLTHGYTCLLETNGSVPVQTVPSRVIKILDWKTPGSGYPDSFCVENLKWIGEQDQIKFVITSRRDYIWAMEKVHQHRLEALVQVIFSPAAGMLQPVTLANWLMEDKPRIRLQIQLHRFLYGDKKGV